MISIPRIKPGAESDKKRIKNDPESDFQALFGGQTPAGKLRNIFD
jgi:hypothetical protein